MRIQTMPVAVAGNPREVFGGVNPDAVLAVLLHKIVAAAAAVGAAEGAREGHALLQDWLVAFAEQYNGHVLGAEGGTGVPVCSRGFCLRGSCLMCVSNVTDALPIRGWRSECTCVGCCDSPEMLLAEHAAVRRIGARPSFDSQLDDLMGRRVVYTTLWVPA